MLQSRLSILSLCGVSLFILASCSRPERQIVDREKVWTHIVDKTRQNHLDPGFVYSLVFAESSFNAYADSGKARGIAQMSEDAWRTVTRISYNRAWNWRTNLNVAMLYLSYCREKLQEAGHFNYPLLAASYRYGPNAVARADYSIANLPTPTNDTYRAMFAGHIHPVPPPGAEDSRGN